MHLHSASGLLGTTQCNADDTAPHVSGQQRWCPEETCSLFSHMFFLFPNGLMKLGSEKVLDESDLWDLARGHEAAGVHAKYAEQLQRTSSSKYPHVRLSRHHSTSSMHPATLLRQGATKIRGPFQPTRVALPGPSGMFTLRGTGLLCVGSHPGTVWKTQC